VTRIKSFAAAFVGLGCLAVAGCGSEVTLFNSAFLQTFVGGQVPVAPGPPASFVLVRGVNSTSQNVEFVVTVEREALVRDDDGSFVQDDNGNFVTQPERETVSLVTSPNGLGSDLGVIFDCSLEPVTVVGLGENLLPTDAAIFVGGTGAGGTSGFGVTAPNLNPLRLSIGNYNCGDTIIYQAFTATGVSGGVSVQAFLLPGSEQPTTFAGPSTFQNLRNFLESQEIDEE